MTRAAGVGASAAGAAVCVGWRSISIFAGVAAAVALDSFDRQHVACEIEESPRETTRAEATVSHRAQSCFED